MLFIMTKHNKVTHNFSSQSSPKLQFTKLPKIAVHKAPPKNAVHKVPQNFSSQNAQSCSSQSAQKVQFTKCPKTSVRKAAKEARSRNAHSAEGLYSVVSKHRRPHAELSNTHHKIGKVRNLNGTKIGGVLRQDDFWVSMTRL